MPLNLSARHSQARKPQQANSNSLTQCDVVMVHDPESEGTALPCKKLSNASTHTSQRPCRHLVPSLLPQGFACGFTSFYNTDQGVLGKNICFHSFRPLFPTISTWFQPSKIIWGPQRMTAGIFPKRPCQA